jgi:hypothetical protein
MPVTGIGMSIIGATELSTVVCAALNGLYE